MSSQYLILIGAYATFIVLLITLSIVYSFYDSWRYHRQIKRSGPYENDRDKTLTPFSNPHYWDKI